MKKLSHSFVSSLIACIVIMQMQCSLPPAPEQLDFYHEIAVVRRDDLPDLYNDLTPQERVFLYYMFRASLPGNRIAADQIHRHAVEITELFEELYEQKEALCSNKGLPFNTDRFFDQVKTYLVYLWTNHGQYFMKDQAEQKRTPAMLGLDLLTKENLIEAMKQLGYKDARKRVERLANSIFEKTVESTLSVPGSIDKSAMNLYSADFTDEDFQSLSLDEQSQSNSYCFIEEQRGKRIAKILPYKVGGKYDRELSVSLFWLEKALAHARKYPKQFDEYIIESLEQLCAFLKTGDENLFKEYSKTWLKSNSRIDYNFGFIESYMDPKAYRGQFEADLTLKSIDMQAVNNVLPILEAALPFPAEFKRDNLMEGGATCPNASINTKVFSAGLLGPLNFIFAYCLPNYEEIRSAYGSKQIIYNLEKELGERINAQLYRTLFKLSEDRAWADNHDPNFAIRRDILMLHIILHETLGHGSGKFVDHTFVEGDPMVIDGVTYKVGDTIEVTSANEQIFLEGYRAALEELRAEIIALLSSIINYDDLATAGLLGEWPKKVAKEKILELLIKDMCEFTLFRWQAQPDDASEISGAHAQANSTILFYLLDHGGIELVEEKVEVNNEMHTVLGVRVTSLPKAIEGIKDLAIKVQTIKSTADGQMCKKLMGTYGKPVHNPEHLRVIKKNMKTVMGPVKVSASLFPYFEPLYNEKSEIVDIKTTWPTDIVEQHMRWKGLIYSYE